MKRRFAQMIRLSPEGAEAYIEHHAAVWPGVLATIKACHLQNYSIFVNDLVLFAYFEYNGDDFEADMKRMAAEPETRRWWNVVKPLMDPLEKRKPGEFWSDMTEIFHLD
ncbi:MAG: L-rhamnose mutarotase [Mangrovibacterium sp.]